MKAVKFLHFSDLHLDMPFSSLKPGFEKQDLRRQDLLTVFDRIMTLADEEKTDIILIAGDLYEHHYVKKSTIDHINRKFRDMPQTKVFIIPGNHDPFIRNSIYNNYKWSNNVYILSEENPLVTVEDLKLRIYGVAFKSFYEEKASLENLGLVDESYINILLIHGTLDMNFRKSLYNPVKSTELAALGMDYVALGHFHRMFKKTAENLRIYNPGSPEPLGFDEEGEHGVFIGSIEMGWNSEKKFDIGFYNVSTRDYRTLEVRVDSACSDSQVIDMITCETEGLDGENMLLNIVLKGYTEPGYMIDTAKIKNVFSDSFFHFNIENETLPSYNFDELSSQPGLKGTFTRKMMKRIEGAESEKERYLLRKSLNYGIEALDRGKVEI
jgi:DNA repair exonuclease SbcCD nuclease subunit